VDDNGIEIDEFTVARIKKVAKRFSILYAKLGRQKGAEYLDKQKIKQEHYKYTRVCINQALDKMGITLK